MCYALVGVLLAYASWRDVSQQTILHCIRAFCVGRMCVVHSILSHHRTAIARLFFIPHRCRCRFIDYVHIMGSFALRT